MGTVNVLKSSFLSGICIGIAGFGYLAVLTLWGVCCLPLR